MTIPLIIITLLLLASQIYLYAKHGKILNLAIVVMFGLVARLIQIYYGEFQSFNLLLILSGLLISVIVSYNLIFEFRNNKVDDMSVFIAKVLGAKANDISVFIAKALGLYVVIVASVVGTLN